MSEPSIVVVPLAGHLTEAMVRDALAHEQKPAERYGMLFDCRAMTGYDVGAREAFVAWHKEARARVFAVAIVTEKMLWHMVVSAMAFASGQTMKSFSSRTEAETWLTQRAPSSD